MALNVTVIEYRGPYKISGALHLFAGEAIIDGTPTPVTFYADPVEAARIARAMEDGFRTTAQVPTIMLNTIQESTGEGTAA